MNFVVSLLLSCFLVCVSSTPLSHQSVPRGNENVHCKDKDGTIYNVGYNFVRARDNYLCNCTVDYVNLVTRLSCSSQNYGRFSSRRYRPGYTGRVRSMQADHCEFNGQLYQLNTRWKMQYNGMLVDCTCNATARLTCYRSFGSYFNQVGQSGVGGHSVVNQPVPQRERSSDQLCLDQTYILGEDFAVLQAGNFYSICHCTGNSHNPSTCFVLTVSGTSCQFPFEENGMLFSTCTSHGLRQPPHCGTSPRESSQLTISNCITTKQAFNQYFGFVFTDGGNANGARCHFPFVVRGVEYHNCITTGQRRGWCATTSNYERDGRYGFCQGMRSANSVYNRIGESVTLDCRFPATDTQYPIISWYKLTNEGRQLIYTYNAADGTGRLAPSADAFAGRLSVVNSTKLVISDMTTEDAGTFECNVVNQVSGGNTQVTEVSVGAPNPTNLHYTYIPYSNRVTFSWTAPETEFDSLRLELQEHGSNRVRRVRLRHGRTSYTTNELNVGVNYIIRLFTIYNGRDSAPAVINYIGPRIPRNDISESSITPEPVVANDEVSISWTPDAYPNIQATEWLVKYEDVETGNETSVTLPLDVTSHTVDNLLPGRRYRVTLYALVDQNAIEISSNEVVTEYRPVEIESPANVAQPGPYTATIRWSPPSQDVDQYEVTYRDQNKLNSPWFTQVVTNPYVTLQRLIPGTTYDVRITPISNHRRGISSHVTLTTDDDHSEGLVLPPSNLQLTHPTRSSFLATWNSPKPLSSATYRYRIRYEPYPRKATENPIIRTTSQTRFKVIGLEGGKTYVFYVSTLSDDEESEIVSGIIATTNEVCLVNGIWHGNEELFFKRNRNNYMQNCTCTRSRSGGQWQCDPILCREDESNQRSWTHVDETGSFMQTCACISGSLKCSYAAPLPSKKVDYYENDEALLKCPYHATSRTPTVRWYKVVDGERLPIFTYSSSSQQEYEERYAGDLSGRLGLQDRKDLIIRDLQPRDAGLFECHVEYAGVQPTTYYSNVSVISTTNNIPTNSNSNQPQVTTNTISLNWDDVEDVSHYIIEYQDVTHNEDSRTVSVTQPEVFLDRLHPSTMYRITVIPVVDGVRGRPIKTIVVNTDGVSVPQSAPQTTTPAAAPITNIAPPRNLRFDGKGRTSVRALWNAPYATPDSGEEYRIEYTLRDSPNEPEILRTSNLYLQVQNLNPGSTYQFRVFTELYGGSSEPAVGLVTTRPIGKILVQASNDKRFHVEGETAQIYCRYDQHTPGEHEVLWLRNYKNGSFYLLAVYNTSTSRLMESEDVGDYSGRLISNEPTRLLIQNLRSTDDGTYKCVVKFPTGGGSGSTRITVVGAPNKVYFTSANRSSEVGNYLLSWHVDDVPRATKFYLGVRKRGSRRTYNFQMAGNARSFLFRNLKEGRTYEGNVISNNRYGNSTSSDFYFSTPSTNAPNPPTAINLIDLSPRRISFNVDGPRENVQLYRIYYKPEGTSEAGMQVIEGRDNPFTITGLTPNTPYILRLVAVNDDGTSEPLNTAIITPKEPPQKPVLLQTTEEARVATLNISEADDVDYYVVTYKAVRSGSEIMTLESVAPHNIIEVPLEPDTQYQVNIVAVNEGGQSPKLQTFVETPAEQIPPARPTRFDEITPTWNSANLTWSGSLFAVQYYVFEYQSDEDIFPLKLNTTGPRQSILVDGLTPDTKYRVSVKAVGEGGHSPFLVDYFYTLTSPQRTNLTVLDKLPGEVTFQIDNLTEDDVDYFIVQYQKEDSDEVIERRFTQQEIHLDNLTPGSTYRVTLIAVSDGTRTELTQTKISTPFEPEPNLPSTVDNLRVTSLSPTRVKITAEGPRENIAQYNVRYAPADGTEPETSFYTRGSSPVITLSRLNPATRYRVTVSSVYDGLQSTPVTVEFTTKKVQEITPTNLRTSNVEDDEATLEWNPPVDVSLVRRYIVQYKDGSVPKNPYRTRYIPVATPYITLENLTPDTQYFIKLRSIGNNRRPSRITRLTFRTLSSPTTTTTTTTTATMASTRRTTTSEPTPPAEPIRLPIEPNPRPIEPNPMPIEPTPMPIEHTPMTMLRTTPIPTTQSTEPLLVPSPIRLQVLRRGFTDAEIAWISPGSNVDGFLVEYDTTFTRHGEPQTQQLRENVRRTTLEDLIPGTEYQVKLFSKRGSLQSRPSLVTFMTKLDAPSNVHVSPQSDRLIISWINPEGPRAGTHFKYRTPNGVWREVRLAPDVTSYAIPIRSIHETYEVSITAFGRTIESLPRTITVHPRLTEPDDRTSKSPVDLTQVEDTSATLRFHMPSENGFTVTLEDDDSESRIINLPRYVNYYQLENLKPSTQYTMSLANGDSTVDIDSLQFLTKPGPATDFTAQDISPNGFTLTWSPPRGSINGYRIKYRPVSGSVDSEWNEVRIRPSDTEYTTTNLIPSTLYDVTIIPTYSNPNAHRYSELGIPSSIQVTTIPLEVSTTPRTSPAPRPPSNVEFSHVTPVSVHASWTPSPDRDLDLYSVVLKDENGSAVVSGNLRNSFAIFRDLTPRSVYHLFVYAVRRDLQSVPANASVFTGQNHPERVYITNIDDTSFDVAWVPERPTNPLLSGYEVSVKKQDSSLPAKTNFFPSNINQAVIQDLEPGTIYEVFVKSVINQVETDVTNKQVSTLLPAPRNLRFEDVTDNSFYVTWDHPSLHIRDYIVEYQPINSPDKLRLQVNNNNRVQLQNLQPDSEYLISVYSLYNYRRSSPVVGRQSTTSFSDTVSPAHLRVDHVETNGMRVNWEPSGHFFYKVVVTNPYGRVVARETFNSSRNFVDVIDLETGRLYNVQLQILTPTNRLAGTEQVFQQTRPEAPRKVGLVSSYPRRIVMNWKPYRFRHPEISGYKLTYKTDDEEIPHEVELGPRQHSYTISDLTPSTVYRITLQSIVNDTLSEPITTTVRTQPAEATERMLTTTTSPNTNDALQGGIRTRKLNDGNYSIGWRSVSGPVEYYRVIYVRRSGSNATQLSVPAHVNEIQLNKLIPGQEYDISIIAVYPNQEVNIGNIAVTTSGNDNVDHSDSSRTALIEWNQQPLTFSSYRITATPVRGGQTHTWNIRSSETSAHLSDLEPGTLYHIVVEGYLDGQYVTVADIEKTTDIDSPSNLEVTKLNTNLIGIEWSPPNSQISGYSLTYQLDGRGTETAYIPPPRAQDNRKTLRRLQPGQRYVIRLYAHLNDMESLPAQVWAETLVPSPQRFRITQATPNLISISWLKPSHLITHYTLRVIGPDGFDVIHNLRLDDDVNSYTIRDLQPGTRYHINLAAWIGPLSSQPEYKSKITPETVPDVKTKGELTDQGFLLQWKSKSRSVDGFKIVVEPQDGSAGFETTVDRFTKRYELENLLSNIAYIVKVYPVSGHIIGEPSIVHIPASTTSNVVLNHLQWRLQVTSLGTDSIDISWNNPWPDVVEYSLQYKQIDESDEAYRSVVPQPQISDHHATISHLQPGESYTIKLAVRRDSQSDGFMNTLLLNVSTSIPPPSNIQMQRSSDGSLVFTWQSPTTHASSYIVKYREVDPFVQHDYVVMELSGSDTSITMPFLQEGKRYEIVFYSQRGEFRSDSVVVNVDVPMSQQVRNYCTDPDTGATYAVGQNWISKAGLFLMNCTCRTSLTVDCSSGEWCHTEYGVFNRTNTWRQDNPENNKKEECVCNGSSGYTCYPRNCQDGDRWYDEGEPWTSDIDGYICNCVCPSEHTQPCTSTCRPSILGQDIGFESKRR
ncbi:tenascin-X-like [Ciona intestinalis]